MEAVAQKRAALAARVRTRDLVVAPGVFDLISARTADAMGFAALYMTGYGISASHVGLPDAGLITYSQMVERAGTIAGASRTPLMADADTGYGGLLNVRHTVRGYEAAGVAAIQIEDQEFPKKCGHAKGRRVIPLEDMVRKIEVAVEARQDPDMLIIARTDSRTGLGLDEALRRGEAFRTAGADVIFVESPESPEEFERIGKTIDAPLLANMVEQGFSPVLPAQQLREYGFAIALYPGTGFMAAAAALRATYAHLRETGSSIGTPQPMLSMSEMHQLMGFEDVWAFDERWAADKG
jgi:2-methylisocitrate lyase-like PEP mutase family enzyme